MTTGMPPSPRSSAARSKGVLTAELVSAWEVINEMVGLQAYQDREVRYDPQALERLQTTEGFGAVKK